MFSSKIKRYAKNKTRKSWWLFDATDFQSLMYPCFIFCGILGIFPYKLNASNFEASKPRYILSTIVIFVYCVLNLILIHNIIISKTTFGDLAKDLQSVNYYMINSFIVVSTHVLSGPRMRLLQTISKISSKLPSESYQKLSKLIHIKDILGIILLIAQLYIYFSKIEEFELDSFIVLLAMFTVYFTLQTLQIIMMYINCVCVLKACFKRINDNLVHMQKLVVNDIEPCASRLICHVQKNYNNRTEELKILKKWHLMISEAVQMLNIIFSLQLLATIVIIFSTVTFELYFYAVRWKDAAFITLDMHFLDVLLASLIFNTMKITLLVWACETGKNQAQEIGITIHDLLNSTNDEQIKYELQLFSLQILHCKNIFSTKGVTVDATLLAAIVGNITTYLLILMQFLNMSHSCDRKLANNVTQSN